LKAAVLESVGRLAIREVDPPKLTGADQALIQVRAVGICGSEIHAFKGTHPFRKPPSILGHEVTGDILQIGSQVTGFKVGDRVFVDPQWTCGECIWCTTGRHNLCPTKRVLGTQAWIGGLGEIILAPVSALYPLPDNISYVEGTVIEPLSVGVHMVERARVRAGESVVVLGAGAIGMMVAAVAGVRGAAPIVAVDLQPHCLDMATRHMGATHGLMANEGSLTQRILDLTDGSGVDATFLTVGVPALLDQAIQMAACEGRIFFVALLDRPVQLEPNALIDKHLTLLASAMYNAREIQTAIDLVASRQVRAGAMVTHVLVLDEAQRAFALAASKEEGAIKVVIEMGE
jgi:2-desacetyl-2-hydroxyethyl bacteriochlorophyllide A dehydrogenase